MKYHLSPVQVQVRRRVSTGNALASLAEVVDYGDKGQTNVEIAAHGMGFFGDIIKAASSIFGGGDKKTEVVVQQPIASANDSTFGKLAEIMGMTVLERVLDRFLGPTPTANSTAPTQPTVKADPPVGPALTAKAGFDKNTLLLVGGGVAALAVVALIASRK